MSALHPCVHTWAWMHFVRAWTSGSPFCVSLPLSLSLHLCLPVCLSECPKMPLIQDTSPSPGNLCLCLPVCQLVCLSPVCVNVLSGTRKMNLAIVILMLSFTSYILPFHNQSVTHYNATMNDVPTFKILWLNYYHHDIVNAVNIIIIPQLKQKWSTENCAIVTINFAIVTINCVIVIQSLIIPAAMNALPITMLTLIHHPFPDSVSVQDPLQPWTPTPQYLPSLTDITVRAGDRAVLPCGIQNLGTKQVFTHP